MQNAIDLGTQVKTERNENVNALAEFNPEFKVVFEKLAKEAQEINPDIKAEDIQRDFEKALKATTSIQQAWAHLINQNCDTAKIAAGLLEFSTKGEKISMADFYKPLDMKAGAEGTITYMYLSNKAKILSQTSRALLTIFGGNLPELPSKKV